MKPKLIHFIPIYGLFKYFDEYFKSEKRGLTESIIAQWMNIYHVIIMGVLVLTIFYLLVN